MSLVDAERTPRFTASLLVLWALGSGAAALAAGSAGPLDQAFEAAGMTARHGEVDGGSLYRVATAEGHTFELRAVENGYAFSALKPGSGGPMSGLWSPSFYLDTVVCPGQERMAAQAQVAMAQLGRMLIPMMGGSRDAMAVPYEFESPFDANQLLEPLWQVMSMAEYAPSATYPASDRAGTFPFSLEMDRSRLLTAVWGEVAVVSSDYIVGVWSGRNDACSASGLTTWLRAGE